MNKLTTEQRDEIIRDVEQIRIETDYEIKKAISERLYNFINSLVSEEECPDKLCHYYDEVCTHPEGYRPTCSLVSKDEVEPKE